MLTRARRPLSARRPLPWSCWLPSLALGLLVGQSVADGAGGAGAALIAAAALAAPATVGLERAAGTALVLATGAASLGAAQTRRQNAARARAAASLAPVPAPLRGRVRTVKISRGRGDTTWAALDLVLTEPSGALAPGDVIRLSVWKTTRPWRIGETVSARTTLRAPRGFCNDGEDGYARAAWRGGVRALAAVASDRLVTVEPARSSWADPHALLGSARDAITRAIDAAVPGGDERAVLRALVIGDQSAIRGDLRRAYARTGTAHVLSVSGLHIALVAMTAYAVLSALLARWPRVALRFLVARIAACAALLPAAFYALLSGGAVATLRALVMGALGLGAIVLLRRAEVWTALAAAALLLCAADPGVGSDASFQLSFASVAALVVAARRFEAWRLAHGGPWLDRSSRRGRALSSLLGALAVSAAASVVTAPITAYHFGSVALIGVLANLVVVPLIGWLVLLLVLGGAALLPLGNLPASLLLWLAGVALRPGNQLVEWLAAWRWSALDVALASPLQVVLLLALLVAPAVPRGRARLVVLGVAGLLAGWLGTRAVARHIEPRLIVRFLDVGQGDATLVELAATRGALLVDGGGLGGSFDTGERVLVPTLASRRDLACLGDRALAPGARSLRRSRCRGERPAGGGVLVERARFDGRRLPEPARRAARARRGAARSGGRRSAAAGRLRRRAARPPPARQLPRQQRQRRLAGAAAGLRRDPPAADRRPRGPRGGGAAAPHRRAQRDDRQGTAPRQPDVEYAGVARGGASGPRGRDARRQQSVRLPRAGGVRALPERWCGLAADRS